MLFHMASNQAPNSNSRYDKRWFFLQSFLLKVARKVEQEIGKKLIQLFAPVNILGKNTWNQ